MPSSPVSSPHRFAGCLSRALTGAAGALPSLWAAKAWAQDQTAGVEFGTTHPFPLAYLGGAGLKANQTSPLLWGLIWLSIAVVVIIAALVIAGVVKGKRNRDDRVERTGGGTRWIYIGVGTSTLVLIAYTGWTVVTMAAIERPPSPPALTISVTGYQWWWQVHYESADPSLSFDTANEIHIPVGEPVAFRLQSADVIHSFWVPALGGKTDLIPGRTNETWLQADKPGVYRGQCTEYCGQQHSHMALLVVAQPPDEFQQWQRKQLEPAAAPTQAAAHDGERDFVLRCGACHTVRGTGAGGTVGPDLTHLMSRRTLAAGTIDNTIANLSAWIADPQGVKPGTKMPNVGLSGPELQSIRTYLMSLS